MASCFCFGQKAGDIADDAGGARPLPPLQPIRYVIAGPRGSGRRTLAKHLCFADGLRADSLAPEQLRRLRLHVQLAAAHALLLGAKGGRVPADEADKLERAAAAPLDVLDSSPEQQKSFLETASAFAKLDSVRRACARPGNPALRDTATSLFVPIKTQGGRRGGQSTSSFSF